MTMYNLDLWREKAKKVPFLYSVVKWFYIRMMKSKDPRVYARYYFIRKLDSLIGFLAQHHMSGGVISDSGDFYLSMPDDIHLFYNYRDNSCTSGDGQSLDFKSSWAVHPLERFLIDNLDSDSVYIDVGANNGYYYSLKVGKRCPGAQVYAFEPDIKIIGHLKKNIEFNRLNNITVITQALSNYVGKAYITADLEASNYLVLKSTPSRRTVAIECNTLDNYVTSNKIDKINFIKVDIEGGEYNFLQGARQSILKYRPLLVLELNEQLLERSNASINRVLDFTSDLSYRGYRINESFDVLFIPLEELSNHTIEDGWLREISYA